jgi:hypothetical protein
MKLLTSLFSLYFLVLVSCTSSKKEETTKTDNSSNNSQIQTPKYAEANLKNSTSISATLYVSAQSGLSLRQGTNLKSKKILTIPYGSQIQHLSSPKYTTMTVAGIEGDMIEVNYQGATGFVFSGYLSTLSPPLEEETATAYAKRLSAPEKEIKVSKIKSAKGDAYGLTTSLELPAKSWGEAYSIAQSLFDIPKNILVDLANSKKSTIPNTRKRPKTITDEVRVSRDEENKIKYIKYFYQLRDYSRTVTILKGDTGYLLSEEEVSN